MQNKGGVVIVGKKFLTRRRVVGSELLNFFSTFLFILVSVVPIIKVVGQAQTRQMKAVETRT